jgi:hypothetical protein
MSLTIGSFRCVANGAATLVEPVDGADDADCTAGLAEPVGAACALGPLAVARVLFESPAVEQAASDETATAHSSEARRTIETVRPSSRTYSAEGGKGSAEAD